MANKPMIGEYLAETLSGVPAAVTGDTHFVDANKMGDDEITARVLQLKVDAGSAILEIGRWLTVMKERKAHGEWLAWLEQVDIHERAARRYMQLYEGYSSNRTALSDLGPTKALTLLALPPKEREEFLAEHDVVDMTSRQLDEAIKRQTELEKERDEALKDAEDARAAAKTAEESRAKMESDMTLLKEQRALDQENSEKLRERVKELETHKDVYQDEEAIKKAADEARAAAEAEWSAKVKEIEDKLAKAKEKEKAAAEKVKFSENESKLAEKAIEKRVAGELDAARAEAEQLRAALEEAKKAAADAAVASDADFTQCLTLAEQIKSFANTINGVKLKALNQGDEIKAEKLQKLILRIADDVRGCA